MASMEHIQLSDFIKSMHKKLREEANILGIEQAWKNHCEDEENLEKYALAMQGLAVNHWDKISENNSRVFWVYAACKEYFANIERYRDKEIDIMKNCFTVNENIQSLTPLGNSENSECTKYKLLDAGSCYNPFNQFEIFDVVAVDIAPANNEVFKCDFLNLSISDRNLTESDQTIIELKESSFDVIVFSLLLEYFPSPKQRLKCCLNAYKLLKNQGILVIITPDSNHVGSNSKIFKSWRYVLAKEGFIRVKYEKLPYIHCMVFRKAQFKEVAQRWAEVHESEDLFQEIFIPQDFTKRKAKVQKCENVVVRDEWCGETFLQDLDCSVSE